MNNRSFLWYWSVAMLTTGLVGAIAGVGALILLVAGAQ